MPKFEMRDGQRVQVHPPVAGATETKPVQASEPVPEARPAAPLPQAVVTNKPKEASHAG